MIVEWFVAFATGLLGFVADLLPVVSLDGSVSGALSWVMVMDGVAPVSESIGVALMLASVYGLLVIYRLFKVLIAHVPFVGGTG